MKEDLDTLRRLLQRNKNQHRRAKYFQLISGAEKKLRRWVHIVAEAEAEVAGPAGYDQALLGARKAVDLLRKGAACITQLIAKEFFMPFAIVMLVLVSTLYRQAEKAVNEAELKLMESQEIGSVVERKEAPAPFIGDRFDTVPHRGSRNPNNAPTTAVAKEKRRMSRVVEKGETVNVVGEKRGFVPEGKLIRSLKKLKKLTPKKLLKHDKDKATGKDNGTTKEKESGRDAIDDIFSAFD